ncbi:hypothetical protein BpHYR1_029162, partial [Brachionus plicatilis]
LNPDRFNTRINKLLNLRNESKEKVTKILKEYQENLGDDETKSSSEIQQEHDPIKTLFKTLIIIKLNYN